MHTKHTKAFHQPTRKIQNLLGMNVYFAERFIRGFPYGNQNIYMCDDARQYTTCVNRSRPVFNPPGRNNSSIPFYLKSLLTSSICFLTQANSRRRDKLCKLNICSYSMKAFPDFLKGQSDSLKPPMRREHHRTVKSSKQPCLTFSLVGEAEKDRCDSSSVI